MSNWTAETLLIIHTTIVSAVLLLFGLALSRNNLFRWDQAGFWAWSSFLLYYVLNPFFSLIGSDLSRYSESISITEGVERGVWILFVTVVGISVYFFAYQHTKITQIPWRMKEGTLTLPMILVEAVFMIFGFVTLFTYRTADAFTAENLGIINGRFTGNITGYASAGYLFLYVPIVCLILAKSRSLQLLGVGLGITFIFFTLLSGWSRVTPISFFIAIMMVDTYRRKAKFPRSIFIPIFIVFAVSSQMRGHVGWDLGSVVPELSKLIADSFQNIGNTLGSTDASMLPTWYIESYVKDTITGFDFGIPPINYILTGWIPSRILPQKYFMIEWLRGNQSGLPMIFYDQLYGAKPSMLGSFYGEGGILAVIILSGFAGFFTRKIDAMLLPGTHLIIKALAISWISFMWMVWGSHDVWALMLFGVLGMPAFGMWIVAPKYRLRKIYKRPHAIYKFGKETANG